ncbi:V-type proton ATPase subunit S1 [Papilio xuthus]|uniref:V-type proton ATPase subunit S1 n=1 Tax=Papilio xuthus TaxID=66420 RepID=A0A194Q0J9_PAPXU|nr:V-type proton ATPase subunit S1 [Papilio xuthus]
MAYCRLVFPLLVLSDPFTVIFIEETLSVEDFSSKTSDGEVPLRYLRANLGDSYYLPSVTDALEALNSFADVEKENHVKLTENGLSAEIEPEGGNFLFIELKDANERDSRADLLRRHNEFMEDMFAKLHNRYEKVVAIYTARNPSWTVSESHRVRRQATEDNKMYRLDGLLLYVEEILLTESNLTTHLDNLESSTSTFNDTSNTMSTDMKFGADNIQLNFVHKNGYWTFGLSCVLSVKKNIVVLDISEKKFKDMCEVNPPLVSAVDYKTVVLTRSSLTKVLYPEIEVYSLTDWSYRCGERVTFNSINGTISYSLTFRDMEVQPFFKTMNASDLVFGDSFNCIGFFSVPIWSGLFVVFIFLAITFYGIMMMMDIRTMDRFDDPKGKTITINAAE